MRKSVTINGVRCYSGERVLVLDGARERWQRGGNVSFYRDSEGKTGTLNLEHDDCTENLEYVFVSFDDGTEDGGLVTDLALAAPSAPEISEHQRRKEAPVFRGFIAYFPDAIMEAARLSRIGNEQHNPGQPMHWAFGKSMDHNDCVVRHMIDFDEMDVDDVLHATKEFWRAGSNLQTLLEKRDPELHARRQAQRDRAARGER